MRRHAVLFQFGVGIRRCKFVIAAQVDEPFAALAEVLPNLHYAFNDKRVAVRWLPWFFGFIVNRIAEDEPIHIFAGFNPREQLRLFQPDVEIVPMRVQIGDDVERPPGWQDEEVSIAREVIRIL